MYINILYYYYKVIPDRHRPNHFVEGAPLTAEQQQRFIAYNVSHYNGSCQTPRYAIRPASECPWNGIIRT